MGIQEQQQNLQSKLINTPLVLVHGYLTSSMHFHKNIADLMTKYKEVYLIDLPGHGATDYHMKIVYPAHEPQHKIELHFENKFEYNEKGRLPKTRNCSFTLRDSWTVQTTRQC